MPVTPPGSDDLNRATLTAVRLRGGCSQVGSPDGTDATPAPRTANRGAVGPSWHDRPVTTVLQYLVIAAVIGLVVFGLAVVVFGRGEQLAPLSPRSSPTELPDGGIAAADVRKMRFAMSLRGYRMSDVDWALERMADEIDRLRDRGHRPRRRPRRGSGRIRRSDGCRRITSSVLPRPLAAGRNRRQPAGEQPNHRMGPVMTDRVDASVDLPSDPETAFAAVVDLPSQEKWIIATTAVPDRRRRLDPAGGVPDGGVHRPRQHRLPGHHGGDRVRPAVAVDHRHEGDFVQGVGIFEVEPTAAGCRFTWAEELDLPFGVVGRLGWPLAQAAGAFGLLQAVPAPDGQEHLGKRYPAAVRRLPVPSAPMTGRVTAPPETAGLSGAVSGAGRPGRAAGGGRSAPEYVEYHDQSGAVRCTATTRSTSGSAWRRSSPG